MSLHWPSDHMSRRGLADFIVAAVGLPMGVWVLRRSLPGAQAGGVSLALSLVLGFGALVACGFGVFSIVRRREYPWILALAAIALPLFEPSQAPYHAIDRVVLGLRDIVLIVVVVAFLVRSVARSDELERRTHLEALSWSYAIVVVVLVSLALVQDVLPPVRSTWIASGMLATWFVAWVIAASRYQT